ncbi:hypothetical protein [uncultured Litoreibacter sp.]|uniref:hypothetical protein n=1 Tax=uncultured Litoreibacter sp. TaxID=1392394 RepID=UPI00260F0335|nr:hypothetical protein [uncultured Litoreibacter sp.]
MIWLAVATWGLPVLLAGAAGYWHGRRPAQTLREFATDVGYMLMMVSPVVFIFHIIWLRAVMVAEGGVQGLGYWSMYWTALTAVIWLPFMVVCYILRSKRGEES